MKNESINPNLIVAFDTNFVDQILFVTERTQPRKEPAVTAEALAYITC